MTKKPFKPEIVDDKQESVNNPIEQVSRPTKLIRIASMIRSMLEELRRAPLDEEGRKHLADIHERSMKELNEILSPELKEELNRVVLPLTQNKAPSESELRISQAQLVGWLEGLFHGIQATLFTQQMSTQGQMEEVKKRMLESGALHPQDGYSGNEGNGTGAYL
ncbi:MAG: DUF2587 domain-containing protein [Acidimicrobiia bacterium]|nr:DUF2587 domain-containing protein [Acidimicrobiia bacterium]